MKRNITDVKKMTSIELKRAAYGAIFRELGAAGLIRFIQEHSLGTGDYTKERRKWLPRKSARELAADIKAWRKSGK